MKEGFVETRANVIKNSLKFHRVGVGLGKSYTNLFSGSLFWHQGSNVLLSSDPAFSEGLCTNGKPHPTAAQNNIQPRSTQASDLSHRIPQWDLRWELNTIFII